MNRRQQTAQGLLLVVGLSLFALTCARRTGPTGGTDSSSHWLLECSTGAECGASESCLCGVCTRACANTSECVDLDAQAECLSPDVCAGASACLLPPEDMAADGGSIDATTTPHTEVCYAYTEEECQTDPLCIPLYGDVIDLDRECLGPSTFSLCMPADTECGGAFTVASDPSGECALYSGACYIPYLTLNDPACPPLNLEGPRCAEVDTCFSPTTNQDQIYEEGAVGCACSDTTNYCVFKQRDPRPWQAAVGCGSSGLWLSGEDGACAVGGPCDKLLPSATACGRSYEICVEHLDGTFCGRSPRDGYYAELSTEECENVGGEITETCSITGPPLAPLRARHPDGRFCCVEEGHLSVEACELLGATAFANPGDGSLNVCPNDRALLATIRPSEEGGLCCR